MKIALVHEFLTQLGGAEKILETFHQLFPEAPVYTLIYDQKKTENRFVNWDIRTSYLQKFYNLGINYKLLLPFMPGAIQKFDFAEYELVLSDSSAFAKGVRTRNPTRHICYCHTPTRYLWENMDEYLANTPFPRPLKTLGKYYLKNFLKKWDWKAAQNPDRLIANSKTVKTRIKKYYNRDSEVIYPPVDTKFYDLSSSNKENFYLTGSRLEPYKKIDLVIMAMNQLGLDLKIVGTGTNVQHLKSLAGKNIQFLGRVSDQTLKDLYGRAKAFIFPALEDAGIMVLESLACGTPVIGYKQGGTGEFIRDQVNGVLFENQTPDDIIQAIKRFEAMDFVPSKLRDQVMHYDTSEFKSNILSVLR